MISIVTPTVRDVGILEKCLKSQTFQSFEWLICTPKDIRDVIRPNEFHRDGSGEWVAYWLDENKAIYLKESPKKEGEFYKLNSSWNTMFRKAKGELIVSIVDQTWIPDDTLEILWSNYEANSKACISAIGNQYEDNSNKEPQVLVWQDPRARADLGSFYETYPTEMEFCVASVPKQAIIDCGGIDEEFDKYAALSEKEMMARIDKLGYQLYIDQSIQYKAIHHPRLNGKEEWDKHYFEGCKYYDKCIREIIAGKRKQLDFLS